MQLYAFEQADGDYVLALWRHASIWDRANQQPITVTPGTPCSSSFVSRQPLAQVGPPSGEPVEANAHAALATDVRPGG